MRLFKKNEKQVKFVPNQDFLDEGFRFLKGVTYKVAINRVRYFERNGWIEGSIAAPPSIIDLEVDETDHGTRDNLG